MTSPSPDSPTRSATRRLQPNSRTGRSTGRTCSIPLPVTSRPAAHSDSSATAPGFVRSPTGFGQDGFDEGNAEQYVWWVPHNVAGLVTALGGRQAVADRLDQFTKELNEGPDEPYLWAGNEPGFGVPWLYNYVGQPWKTQHTVDRVRGLFGPTPDGEPGNDDLGAMSSWYVWAALGLYPSTPGTPILTVNTPLFDRAVIALPGGKSIRIFAPGASGPFQLKYISGLQRRRPVHRSHVAAGVDHPHRRRPHVLACRLPRQGLGHRRVRCATVVRCGQFGGDREHLAPVRHDRAGTHRHRDPRRSTDDRRRQRLHHQRHVHRHRDHRSAGIRTVRLRWIGRRHRRDHRGAVGARGRLPGLSHHHGW